MSEERVIRINKVLRELNISLDRAVDYLKEKGHTIESSPNAKISNEEYSILCGQFSADKGKKVASLEVSEEKKKEKEALRIEREKEIEDKRKQDEERQRQEIIKAKATLSGPKAVGKIDLDPKKPEVVAEKSSSEKVEKAIEPTPEKVVEKPIEAAAPVAEEPKIAVEKTVKAEKTEKVEKAEKTEK